jgi:CheY-like chemotaxis protein
MPRGGPRGERRPAEVIGAAVQIPIRFRGRQLRREMAAAERPDIILMDLKMPVVDGWEATRRLKGNPQTRDIPIIALSAHALAGEREKALAAGCNEFDTKPIEFDRLGATAHSRRAQMTRQFLNMRDFKAMDHRPLAVASQRFRTIKICPKHVAFV